MYNKKVMEIFLNPMNVGEIRGADGVGEVGNAACGDIMKMYLKVENEIIVDAKFKTFGCAAAIVSTSLATELVKGKTIEEALQVTNQQILDEMGDIPSQKIHCSVMAEEAIFSAVENYKKKKARKDKKEKKQASA
jgi:nitrogen fixation NifU-like protein